MNLQHTKTLTVFAPAKINLYLHVTGRMDDGYHALDTLAVFSDVGDTVEIAPALHFEFSANGPFAKDFKAKEMDASPNSSNIAVVAAWALARAAQKNPNVRINLTKNLPLAAGIGGGSADAAAVLWGLMEFWGIPRNAAYLPAIMKTLGADVPMCFSSQPARARGVGDILDGAPVMDEIPIVLVNPGTRCPTAEVFKRFHGRIRSDLRMPVFLEDFSDLTEFLKATHNDLEEAAMEIAPGIAKVLQTLGAQKGCALARMSGSGATCFGLFEDEMAAQKAAKVLAAKNPRWWVKAGWLNRVERY